MRPPNRHGRLLSKTAHLATVSLAIALSACGGGDTSTAPPAGGSPSVATSIAANSSTSLTVIAGDGIAELPSVIVKDQRGAGMSGILVTFTVTSGGGTIVGSSVTTNASGVATVGGWTLGTQLGPNSLTASTSGLSSIIFTVVKIGTDCTPAGSAIACVLLPRLGGNSSQARAVNDAGVVVGFSTDNTSAVIFAVRWTATPSGSWSITQIAGPDSYAVAVNENGAAVGVRAGRAKLWPATGGEIDLGPHLPFGINSAETVVGARIPNTGANSSQRAVIWRKPTAGWALSSENAPQDLPSFPGGSGETVARAINDAGVIAGWAGVSTPTSIFYAVRWDPVGDQWAQAAALSGIGSFSSTSGRAINENAEIAGHVRACLLSCSSVGIFWPTGSSGTSLEPFFGGGSGFVEGVNNAQRAVGVWDTQSGRFAYLWWPGQTLLKVLSGPSNWNTGAYDINNQSPAQAVGFGLGTNGSRAIVWTIP